MRKLFPFLLFLAMLWSFVSCEDATRDHDKDSDDGSSSSSGAGKYEAVDLGLPSGTLWATFNVGATKPEECGDYFAWGETRTKSEYSWSTYRYGSDFDQLTKYCNNSISGKDGFIDNETTLDASDDAATANWGGAWRMPTQTEMQELIDECDWDWRDNYNETDVAGYIVTGKNNESIFLPAAGYRLGTRLSGVGSNGHYWSSSLHEREPSCGYCIDFTESYCHGGSGSTRCYGLSIRAVCPVGSSSGGTNQTYTVTLDVNNSDMGYVSGAGDYKKGEEITISATAYDGYKFVKWSDSNTDNPRQIVITEDITLIAHFDPKQYSLNGHEYVDLGLPSGILWATCNVGANSPEEYGDYFAWGEIEPKEDYSWNTYAYGNAANQLTKYCISSAYGAVDNKTVLEAEDDAATANWGGGWRMPTSIELIELCNTCTWERGDLNGVEGYYITSTNGNYIFLPATGFLDGTRLYYAGSYGYYWSSSLGDIGSNYAYYLDFNFSSHGTYRNNRYHGQSVRPVCSPQ